MTTATPARARLTDPATSWDAALAVNATKSWLHFAELIVIEKDEWIGEELTEEAFFTTTLTPSRVRTIVSDWKKQGYVRGTAQARQDLHRAHRPAQPPHHAGARTRRSPP